MTKENDIIKELSSIIKNRIDTLPDSSYVSKISKKGKVKIANKFGEESFETVAAFLSEGDEELKEEVADLVFHLLILLGHSNVEWSDVLTVLKKRMKND
ncbi:MAG: phosphoribosyl-ATP diphosphatase [Rickettsiales bacterium]|nr:phosphoribosyl-ATP diphosphatase [Rickettsiales bacterium]|tara:strand:+ start:444 stop:740 length:297 start_codon:yes stop_codon:yes gene_type:complete